MKYFYTSLSRLAVRSGLALCLALGLPGCGDEGNATPPSDKLMPTSGATYEVKTTENIQYGMADVMKDGATVGMPLYLDLYEPADAPAGKRPVVMWMFGSAFVDVTANRKAEFVPIAKELAARGYVVASIDYRTAYLYPVVSTQAKPYLDQIITPVENIWVPFVLKPPAFPATLTEDEYERAIAAAYDDGLTALKWISSQATARSLDIDRLVLMGSSSGATTENSLSYLSDEVGIETPKIAVMVHLWGSMDYSRTDGLSEIEIDEAPLFMIHSIGDKAMAGGVDYANAEQMAKQAESIGLSHELITLKPDPKGITPALVAGTGHGLVQVPLLEVVSDNGETLFQRIVNFVNAQLQ